MRFSTLLTATILSTGLAAPLETRAEKVLGQDVSNHQGTINWKTQKANGSKFMWAKATEGTTFIDKTFNANYKGANEQGIYHGAYHYAHPTNDASKELAFFLKHGGKWTNDGKTLPGGLDLEYGTKAQGGTCWGVSKSAMVKWVKKFGEGYKKETGRYPVIYSTYNWWATCTGDPKDEFKDYPFWIASPGSSLGKTPKAGPTSFWQFSSNGKLEGDSNYWLGSADQLKKFVKG